MSATKWSAEEEAALAREYPEHGAAWDGWHELLPGRSYEAIRAKAHSVGVISRKYASYLPPDPHEARVMRCMRAGMTPSQIDRREKWWPGTAKRILTSRWERLDA